MIRRRLVIEWNDDGNDTDEECRNSFLDGEWGIQDLLQLDLNPTDSPINLKVWVEDAPTEQGQ